MNIHGMAVAGVVSTIMMTGVTVVADNKEFANRVDRELGPVMEARDKDWRNGAVVYQVLVDRFAPPANMDAKRHLYPAPKTLHDWSEEARRGKPTADSSFWTHELAFWGGDLDSLGGKLDHIQGLGIDVLYLNPIHHAYTNHKYDAMDYKAVSPEFGDREDLKTLTGKVHDMGMKIVLDGVFNHMGRNAPIFKDARANADSPYRDWFYIGDEWGGEGYRAWANAYNLPEVNLENQEVRDHIWAASDSVVRGYLAEGIDGWRLDVAYDIGFNWLEELTEAAHDEKPGSLVVGELWNYPSEWFPSVDGTMNFPVRDGIIHMMAGDLSGPSFGNMFDRIVRESGIENMLKSWLVIDNHDTRRLPNMFEQDWQRRMAQVIQFTLPGSPNVYYGSEVGMEGGSDPENRSPMRWDLVNDENEWLTWMKGLIAMHKDNRALRIGNLRLLTSEKLLAYERYTDVVDETIFVIANPSNEVVRDTVMVANSKAMSGGWYRNILNPEAEPLYIRAALGVVELQPGEIGVYRPDIRPDGEYTSFKRLQ